MTTITTRAGKGAPLTNAELDANFTNLNSNKLEVGSTTSDIAEGSNQYFTQARARSALSFTAGSGAYDGSTGVITIPTNTSQLTNGAGFIATSENVVIARATAINSNSSDFNAFVTAGTYSVSGDGTWTGSSNGPTSGYPYGQLVVTVNGSIVTQVYFAHQTTKHYVRSKFNASDWQSWNEILMTAGTQTVSGDKTFTGNTRLQSNTLLGADDVLIYAGATNQFNVRTGASGAYKYATIAANGDMSIQGNFTASGNVTAYSDERLKRDWADLQPGFIESLAAVKMGTYFRVDSDIKQVGVSAQSLQGVMPEAVHEDMEGMLSVAYGQAALSSSVALAREVIELRQRLEALESK